MLITSITFTYLLIVLAVLSVFFWVKTGVFFYFSRTESLPYSQDTSEVLARFDALDSDVRPPSYAKIRLDNNSYIAEIEGYPEVSFDENSDFSKQLALFRGSSSSQRISYNGLELARLFFEIQRSKDSQHAGKIAVEILLHWFSNRLSYSLDPNAWSVTVVSCRRLNCILSFAYLKELSLGTAELYEKIRTEIKACDQHLAKNYTYDWSTNHGLIDDYNLLLGDYLLDAGDHRRANYKEVRSLARIGYFLSSDGVVLEPATSYWFMIKGFLQRILKLHQMMNLPIEEPVRLRFEALDRWLAFGCVDGLYSRIGDTSGANNFIPPDKYKYDCDGVYLSRKDTGLCYLNEVTGRKAVSQLFLNAQYCPPLTHAHQDALAVNLISEGTVWINSPGYFSPSMKDFGVNIRAVENQSTVWCPSIGYKPNCTVEPISSSEKGGFNAAIKLSADCTMTRKIEFDAVTGQASIHDQSSNNAALQSSFLFDSKVKATLSDGICTVTNEENKNLVLLCKADKVELQAASISYKRNEMVETTKLVLTGPSNLLHFEFADPQTKITSIPSNTYPYNLRKKLAMPAPERLRRKLTRLNFGRIKQAFYGLSLLLLLALAIAIAG